MNAVVSRYCSTVTGFRLTLPSAAISHTPVTPAFTYSEDSGTARVVDSLALPNTE